MRSIQRHEKILDVLGAAQLLHCPVLTDIKGYPEADVGIVTGAIRNEHDRHAALEMRKACGLIIALGTCAVYGGLPGAGMVHTREEILQTVYVDSPTTRTDTLPSSDVSLLEKMVTPWTRSSTWTSTCRAARPTRRSSSTGCWHCWRNGPLGPPLRRCAAAAAAP